ncbi:uncharacterized protein LOC111053713 [Nilaparvata lugens]|uniref:uncharacterized protein LOC111053713 n=1 Tax=Nilaparvata lugens TaxID=108931 RepID=UPI00193E5B9D|nr:uncharacterized protein LOC111053713 [Nilaparvata lugens]XP_039293632.1 uncharacterized protein LOC111053713 [Nilaparvata lugens]
MKKEPANAGAVGTKKTGAAAAAVHHTKSAAKRVSADVEEKKRKAGSIMTSAPANMPLAVVVVEVQTSQNVKGKAGVESKVKKKSVTLKTTSVPVKKVRSPSPKKNTTEESKTKQAKPKKVIATPIKTPKLKATKKADTKKPTKAAPKAKSDKLTKKQKLAQEKQQQKKQATTSESVPTSPITVVISEQDGNDKSAPVSISCKKTSSKPAAKKQTKSVQAKKSGVAAGKIGKRKPIIKKTVAKEIGKAFKSDSEKKKDTDKSSDMPASDQAPSDKNEANQPPKKVTSNKKTKNDDASPTLDLDLSSTAVIDKSKTIAKTVKSKGADKPKAVKAKKNTKTTDEQSEENQHESAANDENESTDTAPKTESKKKEKPVKVEKSKVASEKKTISDTKECSKKEETKTKKPKADSKSSSNQQQKSKAKGKIDTVGKTKKTAKVEEETEKECGEKKSDEASDHNDSSTSDELPLEVIKRQQKAKPQPQPQNEKTEPVTKPSIAVKEEKIAYEECVQIKEEIDDLYDFKSSDGDCKVKDELIKEESVKEVSEKKNIKSANKDESSEKDVKKKAVKKPVVKTGAVKAGVKGKAAGNAKAAKAKAAKVPRKASSDDDDDKSDDNQESSDDAKKNKKLKKTSSKSGSDSEKRARRMKLFGFWSGPKKHRVASLNALAKVHCLYENESRVMEKAMIEMSETSSPAPKPSAAKASEAKASKEKVETKTEKAEDSLATTRTLRSNPGLRSVGRHYDILNASSTTSSFTSSDDSSDGAEDTKKLQLQPSVKQKQQNRAKKQQEKQKAAPKAKVKPKTILVSTDGTSEEEDQKDKKTAASSSSSSSDNPDSSRKVKKRRKRNELMMDLKDMVVRKRMASLNASAILAASYSMEKRSSSSSNTRKEDSEEDSSRSSRPERKRKSKTSSDSSPDMEVEDSSCEEDVLIRGGGSKQKVAVIVNQDTDLTITGVYVNSTTRSTHHEGFCSIAGMQYRISSTSHTQTEATAVATETVLHTDHPASVREPAVVAQPGKSYTPLGALSSMQPPGHGHRGGPSPLAGPRRPPPPHHAPCSSTSAFSAPPAPPPQDPAYVHGYYQPAGPLISHHHHHHSTTTTSSSSSQAVAASKLPPATSPPPSTSASAPPASETDQADSAVASCSSSQRTHPPPDDQRIIPPEVAYRYPPYHGYQYYPSPPANIQYPPQPQSHYHQEICYSSPNPYPSPYFPSSSHKSAPYPPPTYHHRRYVPPPQYYSHQELYSTPPPTQMIVPPAGGSSSSGSAPPPTSSSASSYPPPPDTGYPPPPPPPAPMVDGYHPPPPTYPYPAYSTGPPPACYSHSPPNRLAFIDGPTYQGCPCPMQSCPKNVYTGPLTGASKGSLKNHQSTTPLPPVALALPLEPPGAVGPPSPARGSAGMPPPPSPALATARNPNPPAQWNQSESPPPDTKSHSETGLLVISKVVTDSVLGIPDSETNCAAETLIALKESSILMPKVTDVKIEVDEMMTTTYTQQEIAAAVDLRTMATNCRKRRRLNGSIVEVRRLSTESVNLPENLQKTRPLTEVQERLVTDVVAASQTNIKEVTPVITSITESKDDVENRLPTPPPRSASPTVPVLLPRKQQQPTQPHHPLTTSTKRKTTDAGCQPATTTTTSTTPVVSSSKCKKRKADSIAVVKETKKKCKVTEPQPEVVKSESVEPEVKAGKRKNGGKVTERRKSTSAERAMPTVKAEPVSAHASTDVTSQVCEEVQVSQPKKVCRGRKSLEKPAASLKGKNVPKNAATAKGSKKDTSPSPTAAKKQQQQQQTAASSGESSEEKVEFAEPLPVVCNPKKTHPVLKWSNGWSWEGTPYKAKVFLTSDDVPVIRKCYPSMKHKGGDIICPRDCVLLKSGKSKLDLPFVAKVAALWENPEDGEMMMSLLWYYRPEHTDQGRREEDNVDEIFASRHKDINSVACIEDKCFVLTFNEYCRYRKIVRRCEEGLTATERVVPMLDGSAYPRLNRQPPGQVASDLVFFCRRVYDFRQRRMLKNPS